MVHILLGLHVPTEFAANQGVGRKVADALCTKLEQQGEVEVDALSADIDRFNGAVLPAEPEEQAAVLEAESRDEANVHHRVHVDRSEQGEIEAR